jgi:hypothetical protein
MLKGKGTRDGREVLLFGLSFENLKRLREDKPITIWREEMGIPFDIVIFAGETEETMAEAVANPDTVLHVATRRNQ